MKNNRWGIKWQLFGYLGIFVIGILGVLWLFQVVFIDDFYKRIKINEVEAVGEKVEHNIDKQYIIELLDTLANKNEICIVLTKLDGEPIYKKDELGNSSIYNMTPLEYYLAGINAEKQGGEFLHYSNFSEFEVNLKKEGNIIDTFPVTLRSKDNSVIHVKVIKDKLQNSYILLINSIISPVDATVTTIRKQLIYVTIIMLIMAFIVARFIAKKVAFPLTKMSNQAKQLGTADSIVIFEEQGYKEIATLSETLSYASVELTKTESLRKELIANISHDLRTPLTLITGYAELMRDLPTENTPENVQVIVDEGKRLTRLVNDMLDLSKLQAGTSEIDESEFNLTKEIKELLIRYNTLKASEGYIIDFEYELEACVKCDILKMSQVLYNLINNAINYSGEDKRVLVKQIILEEKVRVEVKDWGEGISQEYLPHIWDRYYKVDKTHKRATVGTGLGLSIVKTILEAHNAQYGVSSQIGEGTTFWFELPYLKHSDNVHAIIT